MKRRNDLKPGSIMGRIRKIFISAKVDYFEIFIKGVAISMAAIHNLQTALVNDNLNEAELLEIKALKQKGTRHVRDSLKLVEDSFITPIDQRDIIEILKGIDAGLHSIESVANHFYIMNLDDCDSFMAGLLAINKELCERINELMLLFKRFKNTRREKIDEIIRAISELEEQGDALYSKSMQDLFSNDQDPLTIVKKMEIYQRLEYSGDCFKRVADLIEGLFTVSL